MAKKKTDPVVAAWRRSLHCLVHPYLPVLETLQEMEGRLDSVKGFLESLDPADKVQAAQGVEVGTIAVAYADELLDHFGLWDGEAAPPPANLAQARLVVGNILAFVQERIATRRMAESPDDEEEVVQASQPVDDGEDAALAAIVQHVLAGREKPPSPVPAPEKETPPDVPVVDDGSAGLVVDRETFSVRWRGKKCDLGHTKEFMLIESLNRRVNRFVSNVDLMDEVWEGGDPEANTIQKTVSNLRRKLKVAEMGDLTIEAQRGHYALKLP